MEVLPESLQVYRAALNREMHAVADRFLPGPEEFDRMLRYHLGWVDEAGNPVDVYPGKQIRPFLLLLSTEVAGGYWEQALPAAAAVELLHNFSLIHDDIEDDSLLRRGRAAVWKVWGIANAVNAGDAMFALAYAALSRLVETGVSEARLSQILPLFAQAGLALTRGQYLDMAFEKVPVVSVEDYLGMVGGKSAGLIGLSMRVGAIIAGLGDEMVRRYAELGYNLGLAFQIRDDILGIWGDAVAIGKSVRTDIVSRKKSLPVLYGLAVSDELREIYGQSELSDADVMRCVEILDACGARDFAVEHENVYFERVVRGLDGLGAVPGVALETMRVLFGFLLGRLF